MIGRCNLYFVKGNDSNKRMKSCGHKCQHRAPFKVDTLKVNKQPQDELMRHLSSGTQSFPLAATRDGLRRRCDESSIGTSDIKRRGATMHIKNPKGPSRSPSCSSYVGMTLLAAKATSWGPDDPSSTRLY
ncbi:hypothetical protein CK203_027713 [Vitis vinifera]|uniref:Uncharacterized protein n=1 Tax=Vitis vinifera TaxID=29760 RepID=A0A438IH49_VITVI|nr:hypothetical protein CK203_027713 [Vitis vinifera]